MLALHGLIFIALQLRFALSCSDHLERDAHDHVHEKRAATPTSISLPVAPTVPLVWGDFNVIHTTDTHGWLLGHQKATPPEPNYKYGYDSVFLC